MTSLLLWLPKDSAYHRALDPEGVGMGWDRHAHLLAALAEISDVTNVLLTKANFKVLPGQEPKPIQISRPGREVEKPVIVTGDAMEAAMKSMGGEVKRRRKGKK